MYYLARVIFVTSSSFIVSLASFLSFLHHALFGINFPPHLVYYLAGIIIFSSSLFMPDRGNFCLFWSHLSFSPGHFWHFYLMYRLHESFLLHHPHVLFDLVHFFTSASYIVLSLFSLLTFNLFTIWLVHSCHLFIVYCLVWIIFVSSVSFFI